jgi:hypothetical protein
MHPGVGGVAVTVLERVPIPVAVRGGLRVPASREEQSQRQRYHQRIPFAPSTLFHSVENPSVDAADSIRSCGSSSMY